MPLPMPPVPINPSVDIMPSHMQLSDRSIDQSHPRRPNNQHDRLADRIWRMNRPGVEEYDFAFTVFTRFVGDLAFEHEVELAAEVFVLQKSVGRGIGRDPVKH